MTRLEIKSEKMEDGIVAEFAHVSHGFKLRLYLSLCLNPGVCMAHNTVICIKKCSHKEEMCKNKG